MDLRRTRAMVTNDDGAHGIKILERIARQLSNDAWVVAPDDARNPEITVQGRRKIGDAVAICSDPRGHGFVWIGTERDEDPSFAGSDQKAVNDGRISITPLGIDFTHRRTIPALKRAFA